MLDRIAHLLRIQKPQIETRGLLWGSGTVVPSDGVDGYQTGCVFQHTDGGSGTALYVNEGSVTSCDFNPVDAGDLDTVLQVGEFASLEAGSGIPLSSSQTAAAVVYGDDNGLAITANVYNLRTRLLLTVDQSETSIRALMAQLKLADEVDVATGIYTANQGYLELAGTHIAAAGANLSCFSASLEIGTALTVAENGEACGLHVETTGTGTITNSGTCAGILIDNAASAAKWPVGIKIDGGSAICAVSIGAQGDGVSLVTAHPCAVEVYSQVDADIAGGDPGSSAGIYSRYEVAAAQTTGCNHIAMWGKLRIKADLEEGVHAAMYGYVEASGAGTLISGTATTQTCAGCFAVEFDSNIEVDTGHVNGIVIDSSMDDSSNIGSATVSGIRIKKSDGCHAWPTGIQFDTDSATSCIDVACATTPNTSRTNHGFIMGGRSTDELTVIFAGGVGAEHYEPISLNFNLVGTNPADTSTINLIQAAIYHDTNDMANLRLKCADWWVTVDKDCTDVYCTQNEINFGSGTNTVSGEVAVLGLVLDGGAGTLTNSQWRVINCTLRGAGTPVNSQGIFINQENGCGNVDCGIRIQAEATMTSAFRIGTPEYGSTPTHLFQLPASGTSPIEAGNYEVHGGTIVRISVLVGGVQYYMLASTAPTTQS